MFKVKYNIHPDEITRIKQRLDALEANRPKAESDAAACSPAVEPQSLPRSPDRESLSKVKTFIEDRVRHYKQVVPSDSVFDLLFEEYEEILQYLDELDQGPIAQCPSEESSKEPNSFIEWLISKQ
jgi:hypothetical protein